MPKLGKKTRGRALTDTLVLGGGVIGLSVAVELALRGAKVKVLTTHKTGLATTAAAGMLAPQAEAIPEGKFRDFSLASRALWPIWQEKLQYLSGQGIGYWPCGILSLHDQTQTGIDWQSYAQLEPMISGLGGVIKGGYWYPEDGQVDPRLLLKALTLACATLAVEIINQSEIKRLVSNQTSLTYIETTLGNFQADTYVLCCGSWSTQLLDLPVFALKGQMLALQMPKHQQLNQVLFWQEAGIYLVPRQDGRLVVGATLENVGFLTGTTAEGLAYLRQQTHALLPLTATWSEVETWSGFRPATPDLRPILGRSALKNLWLATGHHRNGILLSPQTAKSLAEALLGNSVPELEDFSYQRFIP